MIRYQRPYLNPNRMRRPRPVQARNTHVLTQFCGYLKEFLRETSVHGLKHMVAERRHPAEIAIWLICILTSVFCALGLIISSWNRYMANPTVVIMEKDYHNWEIVFPAATICLLERMNMSKAEKYIQNTWQVNADSEKGRYLMLFLNAVTNISYNNLHLFKEFDENKDLSMINIKQLAWELQADTGRMLYRGFNISSVTTWTEQGICHTGLSSVAHHFAVNSELYRDLPIRTNYTTCMLQTFCYGTFIHLYSGLRYAVHSPMEVINANTSMTVVPRAWRVSLSYTYIHTMASPSLRDLTISQRKCNYPHEVVDTGAQVYTYHACQMACHKKRALKICKCVLPFYKSFAGSDRMCDVAGLVCASNHRDQIVEKKCRCNPLCEDLVYIQDTEDVIKPNDQDKTTIYSGRRKMNTYAQWRILKQTKYRFLRDIVFSYADLLVSFGGIAAFFLGCSLLSGVELIYFFTLRLFCAVKRKPHS